jgi:hypothetical protein
MVDELQRQTLRKNVFVVGLSAGDLNLIFVKTRIRDDKSL